MSANETTSQRQSNLLHVLEAEEDCKGDINISVGPAELTENIVQANNVILQIEWLNIHQLLSIN